MAQFDAFDLPFGEAHWDLSMLYVTGEITFIPEPATLAALAAALAGLSGYVRRRRKT